MDISGQIWNTIQQYESRQTNLPVRQRPRHAVNLRHPGYPDDNNIILTAEASDVSSGGVDYDHLRSVGCILAGNRWDGFLSLTQEDPMAVGPDSDGLLRGSDYYFHLSRTHHPFLAEAIDKRTASPLPARWPIVARSSDWKQPQDGLPGMWRILAEGDAEHKDGPQSMRLNGEPWVGKKRKEIELTVMRYQMELVPGSTPSGRLVLPTKMSQLIAEGVPQAAHKLPLQPAWRTQVKMALDLFVQGIFKCLSAFLKCDVERDVQFIDGDGRRVLLTAGLELRAKISSNRTWRWFEEGRHRISNGFPAEGIAASSKCADPANDCDTAESAATPLVDGAVRASFGAFGPPDSVPETFPAAPSTAYHLDPPESVAEALATDRVPAHPADSSESVPEPTTNGLAPVYPSQEVLLRTFGPLANMMAEEDPRCDACSQDILRTRYQCLDCDNYNLCAKCYERRSVMHGEHHFLPVREGGWVRQAAIGHMLHASAEIVPSGIGGSPKAADARAQADASGLRHQYAKRLTITAKGSAKIRLLHLWSGSGNAPIKAHLTTVPLSSPPAFEALSYCWGSLEPMRKIQISRGWMTVGPNLYHLLHRLRRPARRRCLWIDAVCINQSDDLEKTAQVTLMRDIYTSAQQTIVWLGEEEGNSRLVFDMCRRMVATHGNALLRELGVDSDHPANISSSAATKGVASCDVIAASQVREQESKMAGSVASELPTFQELEALYALLARPWFTRMWVVQEVAVSPRVLVQCDAQSIDWSCFYDGFCIVDKLKPLSKAVPKGARRLRCMSSTRHSVQLARNMEAPAEEESTATLDVLALLTMYRGFRATDPRDKVFALLGISTSHGGLRPNYSKSREVIYGDVAAELLTNRDGLDLLARCHARDDGVDSGLPSWVPDWDDPTPIPRILASGYVEDIFDPSLRVFSASVETNSRAVVLRAELKIFGILLDKISALAPVMRIERPSDRLPDKLLGNGSGYLQQLFPFLRCIINGVKSMTAALEESTSLAGVDDSLSDQDKFTIFARTLFTDLFDPEDCVKRCKEWLTKVKEFAAIFQPVFSFELDDPNPANMIPLLTRMAPVMKKFDPQKFANIQEVKCLHVHERRIAKTEAGRLCLVPAAAAVGDHVALLRGGKTPYILRSVEEDFLFLGEAFVHGVMYGEAWEDDQCREICIV